MVQIQTGCIYMIEAILDSNLDSGPDARVNAPIDLSQVAKPCWVSLAWPDNFFSLTWGGEMAMHAQRTRHGISLVVVGDIIDTVSILSIFGSSFTVLINIGSETQKLSIDTSSVNVQRK